MIAMQYDFQLPADYDMERIAKRVRDNGHRFDDTPGLTMKAFLSARRGDPRWRADANRYAPFYLWSDPGAMTDFLCGDRFAGVTSAFGWPRVDSWSILDVHRVDDLGAARIATRRIDPIAPFDALATLRDDEVTANDRAIREGALLAISGFDPTTWRRVRFRLHEAIVDATAPHATHYDVLHVSQPDAARITAS